MYKYAFYSRKLQKELGWKPSLQFEEGIEETVKWYLENQEWMDHVTSGEYQKYYEEMYKNSIFRKPTRPSLPLRKAPHLSPSLSSLRKRGCNRPTVLNFLPLRLSSKESSTFSPSPSSSGSGDVTALRCSEPLRSKVGGASKPFAILCRMGPPYYNLLLVFAILCGLGPPGVGSL